MFVAATLLSIGMAQEKPPDPPQAPPPSPAAKPESSPPATSAKPPATTTPDEKPNVLLIVVDTLRRDHLGCYGYSRATSPCLDRFAAGATVFTRSTSPAPWTTPAIGAILSSQWPTSLGIRGSCSALPDEVVLLPEVLHDHGWFTGAVISHSFCSSKWNFNQGFDFFDESNVRGPNVATSAGVTDRALEFVEKHRTHPFFLWVHYFDPHFGYLAHDEWDFAEAPGYHGPVKSGMPFTDLNRMTSRLGEADVDQIVRFYDSEIAFTDRHIGRLLDGLRERGLDGKTWVVFTADHGEEFLDHGHLGHTNTLYGELLRVPLIVKIPALEPGRVDRPVASVDVLPTLLDALQIEPPASFVGRSLLKHRGAKEDAGMRPIFSETETAYSERLRCVQMGPYKLVRCLDDDREHVYNLANDPHEDEDLSGLLDERPELAKRVAALRHELDAWLVDCERRRFGAHDVKIDEKERARLEALGYTADKEGEPGKH